MGHAWRTRSRWGLVALARARLGQTTLARTAGLVGVLVAVSYALVAVSVHAAEGSPAELVGILGGAARWVAWTAGGAAALAAASDRRTIDRREGIEALCSCAGFDVASLESARVLAAMVQVGLAVGAPLGVLALLEALLAANAGAALAGFTGLAGTLIFALATGVTLGAVAALAGRLAPSRGRWLFVGLVLAPYLLASEVGRPSYSIPGALDAVITFVLPGSGGHA